MDSTTERDQSVGNAFSTVETAVSDLLESLTETVAGAAHPLRDGSELAPLVLPRDLYAHANAQTEWWYYTGHAETESGKQFGFELVFFKRRTDLDKFSVVPLRLFGNPIYFAHFALTDTEAGTFRYAHKKSSNGLLDDPAAASESHYYLRLGDWSVRESRGSHMLTARLNSDLLFEATVSPTKPAVLNGPGKDGVSFKDEGEASRYFSFTRMSLEGDLNMEGKVEHFTGSAWMDREFGTWTATEKQKGWDWFSIQFADDTELMVYQLRDSKDAPSEFSSGVFVRADGEHEFLSRSDFSITPTGFWKSPGSGATYPSGWKILVPAFDIKATVTPTIQDQELDTRGTTMIVYWEGACKVSAVKNGAAVPGSAYVELVGYDRSHDNPNLAYFLLGNSFEKMR